MTRTLLFLCALIVFSVFPGIAQVTDTVKKNAPKETYNLVREGRGIDGVTVGKSTMADVAKKYGKRYRWEINKKYSYQMTYDRLGLSFYMCQEDKRKQIFLIEIKHPYKAKTAKGVILGKSTREETEKVYGKPHDGFEYRGVSFYYNKFGKRNLISEIDITENSGRRQCGQIEASKPAQTIQK
jgi:hypothetical protein